MALLTPFSLEDARLTGARYGLAVSELQPLRAGSVNSNFRVAARHVTSGEGTYFARIYEEQDESGAAAELSILDQLADLGIPTTRPLRRDDGKFVSTFAGKPVSFYPWIEGRVLCQGSVTKEWTWCLGVALARVHLASPVLAKIPQGRFEIADLQRRLEFIQRETSAFDSDVGFIRTKLQNYTAQRDSTLPHGLVHGDLFRDNVLVDGSAISALIDFESACAGPFVFDLMVCVHAWCFGASFESELIEGLLGGYVGQRPLSSREVASLETEGALAALRFATTRITDFSLRAASGEAPARDFRRFLQRLLELEGGALAPPLKALGLRS